MRTFVARAPILRLEECESTNDIAQVCAANGLPEGTVVLARRQRNGRGRRGRPWASPEGGLWCSIIARPGAAGASALLSLAAAVAAAEAMEEVAAVRVRIRWPNDLLVAEKKVGGILLEGVPGAVIVGIGINVSVAADALPPEVRGRAGSLHELTGRSMAIPPLLEAVLERWTRWYRAWAAGAGGQASIVGAWSARDATRGTRVVVHHPAGIIEGLAEGIDARGALRIRTPGGEARSVIAGDLVADSGASLGEARGPHGRQEPAP